MNCAVSQITLSFNAICKCFKISATAFNRRQRMIENRFFLTIGLSEQVLQVLPKHLESINYQVISTLSPSDARWIIQHHSFRFIVLDAGGLSPEELHIFAQIMEGTDDFVLLVLNQPPNGSIPSAKTVIHFSSTSPLRITAVIISILKRVKLWPWRSCDNLKNL